MGIPNLQSDAKKIEARERAVKALELRKMGASFRKIAEQLEYADESGARKAVQSLLKNYEQNAVEGARAVMLERLDMALFAISRQVREGSFGAIDRMLKIEERRAKLLGLDAPEKQDFTSGGEKLNWPSIIKVVKPDDPSAE